MVKNKQKCALTHVEDVPQNPVMGVSSKNPYKWGITRDITQNETLDSFKMTFSDRYKKLQILYLDIHLNKLKTGLCT